MDIKKMTPNEKYYWELSEVYLSQYYDSVEPSLKIMAAMGVIVEMESDLAEYHLKNKESEKSIKQKDRLNILRSSIDALSLSGERNLQFKRVLSNLYNTNQTMKIKVEEMTREIEVLKLQLEGI